MNKSDIVKYVAEKANMTNAQAKDSVDATFEAIRVSIVENVDNVSIVGFGTFSIKERAEHQGINPATKEKITIPAKRLVVFKPAKTGWF
ncbi:MAG: HU family DNA-binding protein [Parabacteroides sp.]